MAGKLKRQHINNDGNILDCSTTPDKCDYSRNGDHLEQGASPEEKAEFHHQAEKVAAKAAGTTSAGGGKKKSKTSSESGRLTPVEAAEKVKDDGRLWIGQNGEVVCSYHGGNYLRENVANSPSSPHHVTPLESWVEVTDNPDVKGIPCEICDQQ